MRSNETERPLVEEALRAIAAYKAASGDEKRTAKSDMDDATARFVAHLTSHGVKGNQEEYVRKLTGEGFDTPELFDSLSLEELENDFGFKRGHLRAVEAHRTAHQAVTQPPTAQGP